MFVIYTQDNRGVIVRHCLCNMIERAERWVKDLTHKYPGRVVGYVKVRA